MVYEWDERRARRAQLSKVGLSVFAALVILGVPAWFAVSLVG